jgi:hypothetical protein
VIVIKSTIFRDITPYSPLKVSRHFRGTYCLHLQCWAVLATCCNAFFFLGHEDGVCRKPTVVLLISESENFRTPDV